MNNIKVNLTISVQGAGMVSEQECSKQLRKPVINKKGKYAGKQARDKKGNLLWHYETVQDFSKLDKYQMDVCKDDGTGSEPLTYYVRKSKTAKQVLNITEEAYNYFISNEIPSGFNAHTKQSTSWSRMSKKERLEWHLNNIASYLGGKVLSYNVFND